MNYEVTYTLPYLHSVTVGVEADSAEQAQEIAEQAFADGTIWDDSAEMPLLDDDYYEADDGALCWTAKAVNEYEQQCSALQRKEERGMRQLMHFLGALPFEDVSPSDHGPMLKSVIAQARSILRSRFGDEA